MATELVRTEQSGRILAFNPAVIFSGVVTGTKIRLRVSGSSPSGDYNGHDYTVLADDTPGTIAVAIVALVTASVKALREGFGATFSGGIVEFTCPQPGSLTLFTD